MNKFFKFALLNLIVITSVACSTTVKTHGHIVKDSQLERIKIGEHGRGEVARIMGTPSAFGTFNDKRWYYITETSKDLPLRPNRLDERDVVIINFNDVGVVASVIRQDSSIAQKIVPSEKSTTTQGQKMGVIDQVIQNVGQGF